MIDVHTHILPALDDGPQTFEVSILTALALSREGVTEVVATPFYAEEYSAVPAREVQRRVQALERVLKKVNIPLRVWAGHEAPLDEHVEGLLAQGTLATLNDGPYVLLAPPDDQPAAELVPLIRGLRQKGYIPVLSHIERYVPAAQSENLVPLVEAGALLQVTTASLTPTAPAQCRAIAEELLTRNLAHLLASETSGVHQRPVLFSAGVQAARALVGPQRIWELVVDIPTAIVRGDPVDVPPIRARRTPGHWRDEQSFS